MNIHPDSKYIPLFLEDVMEGSVVIPRFQRDFIWPNERIASLIDSIIKGFPIGSIILWRPDEDQFDVTSDVGGIKVQQVKANANYVLDGRQRVTSLISVLYEKGQNANKFFVDLDDNSVFYSTKRNQGINIMRLCDVFDTFSLVDSLDRIRSSQEIDEYKKRAYLDSAKRLNKLLVTYEIGFINVSGGKIDGAVEIFSRLNSKGIGISPDYMIQALSYNKNKGFLFGEKIDQILAYLDKYNFSKISRKLILNCVYNYTENPFFDAEAEDIIKLDNLQATMEKVEKDVVSAVRFLYRDCFVIDHKLLPYQYQLIMLANFFKYNEHPSREQLLELKRWFFLTSYKSYYTNTSLSNIRRDFNRFDKYCKGEIKESPLVFKEQVLEIPDPPKSIVLSSVRSCSLILSTLLPKLVKGGKDSHYLTYNIPVEGIVRSLGTVICCSSGQDRKMVKDLFTGRCDYKEEYNRFFLSKVMMDKFFQKDYAGFVKMRERMILDAEKDNLEKMFPMIFIS